MASVSGPFIALLELVGGILLLLGVAGRWLGLLYAIEFAVAFFYVKLPAGFQGARLDLMLLAGGLLIFLAGPGKAALDAYWLETEGDRVTGSWSARPEESERGVRRPARLARPPSRHPRRAFRSLRNRRLARAHDGDEGKQLVTRFDQRGADAIRSRLREQPPLLRRIFNEAPPSDEDLRVRATRAQALEQVARPRGSTRPQRGQTEQRGTFALDALDDLGREQTGRHDLEADDGRVQHLLEHPQPDLLGRIARRTAEHADRAGSRRLAFRW